MNNNKKAYWAKEEVYEKLSSFEKPYQINNFIFKQIEESSYVDINDCIQNVKHCENYYSNLSKVINNIDCIVNKFKNKYGENKENKQLSKRIKDLREKVKNDYEALMKIDKNLSYKYT